MKEYEIMKKIMNDERMKKLEEYDENKMVKQNLLTDHHFFELFHILCQEYPLLVLRMPE